MAALCIAIMQSIPFDIGETADRIGVPWTIVAVGAYFFFRAHRRNLEKVLSLVTEIREAATANSRADTETHAMLRELTQSVTSMEKEMVRILEHIRS